MLNEIIFERVIFYLWLLVFMEFQCYARNDKPLPILSFLKNTFSVCEMAIPVTKFD